MASLAAVRGKSHGKQLTEAQAQAQDVSRLQGGSSGSFYFLGTSDMQDHVGALMQGLILVVVCASPGHLSVRRLGGPFAKIEPRGVQLAGEHLRAGPSGSGPNTPETLQACGKGAFGHRIWIRGPGLFTNMARMRRRNKFGNSHWQLRRALKAVAYR